MTPSLRLLCAALALLPTSAFAQQLDWRVLASDSGQVLAPGLPAVSRSLQEPLLGDRGRDLIGVRINSPSAQAGFWTWQAGSFQRWFQFSASGALGPGRSGAEAGHQFLEVASGYGAAAPDGQRLVRARAGDPAATLNSSWGLWRWNGSSNIEIARHGTDGSLGPNLGANWVFEPGASNFAEAQMLNGGRALLVATVLSPGNVESRLVARHEPGFGNRPCLRSGSTDPALAPGLAVGDSFLSFSQTLDRFVSTPEGRVFALLPATNTRDAIFELCEGAPRAIAANRDTAALGPFVAEAGAEFVNFYRLRPSPSQGLVFAVDWRTPGTASRPGIFRHDGSRNLPVAYGDSSGYYGPNWLGSTWSSMSDLSVADDWSAFIASVRTSDGGSATGLWRVRMGERPQLVALLSLTDPAYVPEPGRTWRTFNAMAVLRDGSLVLDASTNPNQTRDLWLLKPPQAPRRLLSIGQSLPVPTTSGPVSTVVAGFTLPGDGNPETGRDGWVGDDGQLLLRVSTNTYGTVLVTTRLSLPAPGALFSDGFE
ncbi:MAG: hypothetical protein H4O13_16045 [Xanthomonadales bacterium]|nr:hypothetical protein [Xanthomonadales bacterium]